MPPFRLRISRTRWVVTATALALASTALCLGACASRPASPRADVPAPASAASAASAAAESGATTAHSAPEAAAEPPSAWRRCQRPDPVKQKLIDDSQEWLEETTCAAALWLDGLFGGRPRLDAARRTSGYLEASLGHSQFGGFETRSRFKVDAELPNLHERLSVFVGRDNQSDVERDRTEAFAVRSRFQELDDDAFLAGLGYRLPDDGRRFRRDYRAGIANLRDPRAFVQSRARYLVYEDRNDLFNLRGTVFYNTRDGFGITGATDYSRGLGKATLARQTSTLTVSQNTEGLDWVSALVLYHNLREERALAWEAFVRGQTGEPEPLREYGFRQIYRRPLAPAKLYAVLLAGYTWPRIDPRQPREGSAEVALGLELRFGPGRRR